MPERRTVNIDDVKPFPGNARIHDMETIKESLSTHGQYRSIAAQESTGFILAGNGTWESAKELGWETIEVDFVDVDDEQAKRIVLIDNRANDLAGYDNQALADLIAEIDTFDGSGFDQDSFDALLASLGPGGFTQSQLEVVSKVPENPVTQLGEMIKLGPHRLYCRDCLDGIPERDMSCNMVWTDPPYLIDYQTDLSPQEAALLHRRTDGKEVTNEGLTGDEAQKFRWDAVQIMYRYLKPGGSYYVHLPPGPDLSLWLVEFEAAKEMAPRQIIVWIKDQFVFGRSDYHYRHEPILYGWREGVAHTWEGGRAQDTIWEHPRPKRSKEHPTIKPIELAIKCLENSTTSGDAIFDPFAGAGTILMAAMQTGRRAVMVEVDPGYCDVIIERYERLTGEKAKRETT